MNDKLPTTTPGAFEEKLKHLPADHAIRMFYYEHQIILDFLDNLTETREKIIQLETPLNHPEYIVKVIQIAKQLLDIDMHHVREETILFPELKIRKQDKMLPVLVSEHQFLKEYKLNFYNHVKDLAAMDFNSYKIQLNFMANGIVGILREHIYRENNFLLPMALDVIQEESVWQEIKQKCDEVGYYFVHQLVGDESSESVI